MPVQRAMAETTSREFAEWMAVLDEEDVRTTKQDYYMAQLAALSAGGGRLSDYLLDFSRKAQAGPSAAEVRAWVGALRGRAAIMARGR